LRRPAHWSGRGVNYTGEGLAKDAKVTLAEARAMAFKAFPGKITDEELEKEKGGSGLRYSFDIEKGRVIHEVGVDAKTGGLLRTALKVHEPIEIDLSDARAWKGYAKYLGRSLLMPRHYHLELELRFRRRKPLSQYV
jgi:hypothetical protein